VTLHVVTPSDLSREERKLLERSPSSANERGRPTATLRKPGY
jgi:hypothetical protein